MQKGTKRKEPVQTCYCGALKWEVRDACVCTLVVSHANQLRYGSDPDQDPWYYVNQYKELQNILESVTTHDTVDNALVNVFPQLEWNVWGICRLIEKIPVVADGFIMETRCIFHRSLQHQLEIVYDKQKNALHTELLLTTNLPSDVVWIIGSFIYPTSVKWAWCPLNFNTPLYFNTHWSNLYLVVCSITAMETIVKCIERVASRTTPTEIDTIEAEDGTSIEKNDKQWVEIDVGYELSSPITVRM